LLSSQQSLIIRAKTRSTLILLRDSHTRAPERADGNADENEPLILTGCCCLAPNYKTEAKRIMTLFATRRLNPGNIARKTQLFIIVALTLSAFVANARGAQVTLAMDTLKAIRTPSAMQQNGSIGIMSTTRWMKLFKIFHTVIPGPGLSSMLSGPWRENSGITRFPTITDIFMTPQ
jgi:hypothetical protein